MKGTTQLKELSRSLRGDINHLKGKLKNLKGELKDYRFREMISQLKRIRVYKQWYLVFYKQS